MNWNEKLQSLRKQKGLTQEELAAALYVSRTAISKWESGRGYPNIDSLKAIASYFDVTVDELLSDGEWLSVAEEEAKGKEKRLCKTFFGMMDLFVGLLFFLPFFGQEADGAMQSCSLLSFSEAAWYVKASFYGLVSATTLFGVLLLALQNLETGFWSKFCLKFSVALSVLGVFLFIISSQPYAAVFLCGMLAIKLKLMFRR